MHMLRRFGIALLVASFGAVSAGAVTGCADDETEQVEISVTERDLSPGRVQVSPQPGRYRLDAHSVVILVGRPGPAG